MPSIIAEQYRDGLCTKNPGPKTEESHGYIHILTQHIRGRARSGRHPKRFVRRSIAPGGRASDGDPRGLARDRREGVSAGALRVRRDAVRRHDVLAADET